MKNKLALLAGAILLSTVTFASSIAPIYVYVFKTTCGRTMTVPTPNSYSNAQLEVYMNLVNNVLCGVDATNTIIER